MLKLSVKEILLNVKYSRFPLLIKAQRQFITATKLRNEAITKKTKHITA